MPDASLPPPFRAYRGGEPFIFVSYAHKDKAVVYPELLRMHEAGYRVWYDEGIIPGEDFTEEIANAICECTKFVVFISRNAMDSSFVRREIRFAVTNKKAPVAIYLEETELSRGDQLTLQATQAIHKFNLPGKYFWPKLEEALPVSTRIFEADNPLPPAVEPKSPGSGTKVVRIPTKGVLFVACNPDRARITVDGKAESPRCVMDLGPGGSRTVLVEVSCPGFETAAYRATLVAGEDVCIDAALDFSLASPGTKIGDTVVNPKDGTEFVWVPGGNFTMGTDSIPAGLGGFFPKAHPVALGGFWIAKNDVTWGQYKEFCAGTKRSWPDAPSWGIQDDHPVVNVSYEDAANYAKWAGCQLPTEEQWEKAARGTDGREYPWGNDWDASKCRFNADSTSPVGSFPNGASPYGCLDMVGNVCVWTSSIYKPGQNYRVIRGGSWRAASPVIMRCACRSGSDPSYRYYGLGFRIAGPVLP
jgi:formylglycine-generating enzyme required for sulfatase activity